MIQVRGAMYCNQATRLRNQLAQANENLAGARQRSVSQYMYDAAWERYVTVYSPDEAAVAAAQ